MTEYSTLIFIYTIFQALRDLFLGTSPITGTIPPSLIDIGGTSPALAKLFISTCDVSGTMPQNLGPSLKILNLQLTKIIGTIPSSLFYASRKLKVIFMTTLAISGTLPDTIGYLTELTDLDLSYTLLSGTVPSTFAALKNLTDLELTHAKFTGVGAGFCQITSTVKEYCMLAPNAMWTDGSKCPECLNADANPGICDTPGEVWCTGSNDVSPTPYPTSLGPLPPGIVPTAAPPGAAGLLPKSMSTMAIALVIVGVQCSTFFICTVLIIMLVLRMRHMRRAKRRAAAGHGMLGGVSPLGIGLLESPLEADVAAFRGGGHGEISVSTVSGELRFDLSEGLARSKSGSFSSRSSGGGGSGPHSVIGSGPHSIIGSGPHSVIGSSGNSGSGSARAGDSTALARAAGAQTSTMHNVLQAQWRLDRAIAIENATPDELEAAGLSSAATHLDGAEV